MTRTLLPCLFAVALLAGCGSATEAEPGDVAATDPATSATPSESPTEPPSIGSYPAYPHADYAFDLETQCFCAYGGQAVTVTVADGEITDVVWAQKSPEHAQGDPASVEWLRLTINDVLKEAANPKYDQVEVKWAEGEDHPSTVAIDRIERAVDDEVTYVLSNVTPVTP